MLGLVRPVRYPATTLFLLLNVPSTYDRRSAPLLLHSRCSYQHTLHHSCQGVSAGGRDPPSFTPRLSWHTALSSLSHAHARAGAFCKAPFSGPTATVVLSYSRYLYLWRLLYPYNTAFSSFLGAYLTLSTPECLLQEVPRHLLSYDCPSTLLLPLFPTPVLHTYHPTLLRLSWGQYGSCSGPPATCLRSLSPRVLCHQFPFSLIRAHLSTQRTPYLFCSLRYPKFLLYAACQRSILSTPRGLRTMHHHVNTLLLLLPGLLCPKFWGGFPSFLHMLILEPYFLIQGMPISLP